MKEKIRLNNGFSYEINSIRIIKNLLKITFDENVDVDSLLEDMSTFDVVEILTRNDEVCGTYNDFNTVYLRDIENTNVVTLSSDGSIYVEPEIPDIEDIPVYVPTLDDVKTMKISELSVICESQIVSGVDVEIDGAIEHFSYKLEDQNELKSAFDLALQTGMSVPYHSDGNGCKLYTVEQITSLYIAQQTNLTHNKTYFNQMKMYIGTLEDIEVVKAITYGDELIGQYLEDYNMIMNQAALIIQKVLENGGAA